MVTRHEAELATGGNVKYDEEVLECVGEVGGLDTFEVVIFQPHLDPELTVIGLDTPDGRRHELDADDALELARALEQAVPALETSTRRAADDS
jgi:hypothetical protein